jgi:hypothetical protein
MTIYVFTGPTLSEEDARGELDAIYLPPAAQGDVYLAAKREPRAIAIIDGYFDALPSIAHKEILWAMARGIHVFGASSMGALRAAELAAFGMVGAGAVFEALQRGDLEDDDEVAVAHAPAEHGFRALSTAMVDIRATLRAAEAEAALGAAARASLERVAKDLFYADRSYPAILERAASAGLSAAEIEALEAFLREGRVHQKREDALALLRAIRERRASLEQPLRVAFSFQHTDAWESVRRRAEERDLRAGAEQE